MLGTDNIMLTHQIVKEMEYALKLQEILKHIFHLEVFKMATLILQWLWS